MFEKLILKAKKEQANLIEALQQADSQEEILALSSKIQSKCLLIKELMYAEHLEKYEGDDLPSERK